MVSMAVNPSGVRRPAEYQSVSKLKSSFWLSDSMASAWMP
jgi:hypothetical protein